MSDQVREEMKANAKKTVRRNLLGAIETMRGFLEQAQRRVERGDDLLESIGAVQHEFAWGMANSASRIESATAAAQDYLNLLEKKP